LTQGKIKGALKTTIKTEKKTLDDNNYLKFKEYFLCLKILLFSENQGISRRTERSSITSHRVIHRKSG
jgi:hypothetical protein